MVDIQSPTAEIRRRKKKKERRKIETTEPEVKYYGLLITMGSHKNKIQQTRKQFD